MPSISDTAYPRLKINPSAKELNELYTPTVYELAFARERARQPGVPAASARKFTLAYCTQHTDPHCWLDRVDCRPISNFSTQDQPPR